EVVANSRKRVWWLGECGHEWEASISRRNNSSNCPMCTKNGSGK
ncbi:zinc-ribbon domain-containing protein, partial [Bacillus thuringiensis]